MSDSIETLVGITRVEVINHIDNKGRVFYHRHPQEFNVSISNQDEGRTLKIFIESKRDQLTGSEE